MRIYTARELDEKLRQRNGFFRGLWLMLCIAGRFFCSLGPKHWSLTKITNAGRVDPLDGQQKSANEVHVQTVADDRKSP